MKGKQSELLEEVIGRCNADSQKFMNPKFDELREDLSNKIGDERVAMEQVIKAKLEDQSDTTQSKLEDFEQNMASKFQEQKENMEGFVENIVQHFEVLLLKQKEDFEQKLENEVHGLQERFNDILTSVALNSDFLDCPTDWVRVIDSCIWVSNEKATFDEAAEKCKELDRAHGIANLYEPPNKNHNDLVFDLLKTNENHWIGVHDRIEEDAWVYLSTNQTISFTYWQSNQPDNHNGNEDCVEFGGHGNLEMEKLWNDLPCDNKEKFICEKKLIK